MIKSLKEKAIRALDAWVKPLRPEDRAVGRAFTVALLGGAVISLSGQLLSLSDLEPERSLLALLIGSAMLILAITLRASGNYRLTAHLTAVVIMIFFLGFYALSGRLYALTFLVAVPVTGMFAGPRAGWIWYGVSAVTILGAAGLHPLLEPNPAFSRGPISEGVTIVLMLTAVSSTVLWKETLHRRSKRKERSSVQRLAEERRRFETLAARTYDILLECSTDGRLHSASPGVERSLGYGVPEVLGKPLLRFVHPDDRSLVEQLVSVAPTSESKTHSVSRVDARLKHSTGHWIWFNVSGGSYKLAAGSSSVFLALRDIEQEHQTQLRLLEMQKMRGIAQLAAGVAHDFNNLLTVITGHAELLEPDESSTQIRQAAHEAAELTSQLLAFGRSQPLRTQALDLNELIRESDGLIRSLLGARIKCHLRLTPNLWTIKGDAIQIRRTLLNLATNARDAMPDGGELEIATRGVEIDTAEAYVLSLAPGPYVEIEVRDNGIGMSEEVRERAVEPFFSTKPSGKGSGLGLASVFGIVHQSGGSLAVRSKLGVGTSISLYFPSAGSEPGSELLTGEVRLTKEVRRARVLVVEDQENVRALVERVLRKRGLQVQAVADGQAAVEMDHSQIDLLITDVVMPGLTGPELAQQLRRGQPQLPVLYMSGYHESDLGLGDDVGALNEFLSKPFSSDQLLSAIDLLLERAEALPDSEPRLKSWQ